MKRIGSQRWCLKYTKSAVAKNSKNRTLIHQSNRWWLQSNTTHYFQRCHANKPCRSGTRSSIKFILKQWWKFRTCTHSTHDQSQRSTPTRPSTVASEQSGLCQNLGWRTDIGRRWRRPVDSNRELPVWLTKHSLPPFHFYWHGYIWCWVRERNLWKTWEKLRKTSQSDSCNLITDICYRW